MSESLQFVSHGLTVVLEPDPCPESPRKAWDNAGTLVVFSDRQGIDADRHQFSDFLHFCEWWQALSVIGGLCLVFWEHTLDGSLGCVVWDELSQYTYRGGYIGACYMTVEQIRKEGFVNRGNVEAVLRGEVEAYSQFRSGDVWGYRILDERGTEYQICWGYYGHEYCREEAIEAAAAISERMALDYCI